MFGLKRFYDSEKEWEEGFQKGLLPLVLIITFGVLDFISIVRTIRTKAGNVPNDVDLDVQTESSSSPEVEDQDEETEQLITEYQRFLLTFQAIH